MNAARKRLLSELKKLKKDPPTNFIALPLEDNILEWHFSIRGAKDTDYEGGIYHGKLILPQNYPMSPPKIIILTPSGRFQINKKICLSISDFHPETWQPSWGIRTAMTALIAFMPTDPAGAVGALRNSPERRKYLAKKSLTYKCKQCGCCMKDVQTELDALCVDENEETSPKDTERNISSNTETQTTNTDSPLDNTNAVVVEDRHTVVGTYMYYTGVLIASILFKKFVMFCFS